MQHKTSIEPFRIKVVEHIKLPTEAERAGFLQQAAYKPFLLHSSEVIVDLLIETFEMLTDKRKEARGLRIVYEPPFLRHFTARFELVEG